MDIEKILKRLVRIGTITVTDPIKRVARVKFEDTGETSGLLYVLANRSYVPDYDVPQRTEFEAGGSGDPAFASHKHDLIIKPWMPKVNAVVLTLYLPVLDGDGFILGEIGELGKLKQWTDQ
ncbi:hypothetical protein AALA83_14855 [Oscillospiraceae bacterium 44-5]